MKVYLLLAVFLLLLAGFIYALTLAITAMRKAWKVRHEKGFWKAYNEICENNRKEIIAKAKADKERRKAELAKKLEKRTPPPKPDLRSSFTRWDEKEDEYDLDTGEVYGFEPKKYSSLKDWKSDLSGMWSGSIEVEFTYKAYGKPKERRKVNIRRVSGIGSGRIYLHGFCYLRQEERTFNIDSIMTKIYCKGKYYSVHTFLREQLGIAV